MSINPVNDIAQQIPEKGRISKIINSALQTIQAIGKVFSDWASSAKIAFSRLDHVGVGTAFDQSIADCLQCGGCICDSLLTTGHHWRR